MIVMYLFYKVSHSHALLLYNLKYISVHSCIRTGTLHHLSDCVESVGIQLPFGIAQTGTAAFYGFCDIFDTTD